MTSPESQQAGPDRSQDPPEPSSLAEESARLKEALHDLWGARQAPAPDPSQHVHAHTEHVHHGHDHAHDDQHQAGGDGCVVCRLSRAAHAVAPHLLDELGRGLVVTGRAVQGLAEAARRHTPPDLHTETMTEDP